MTAVNTNDLLDYVGRSQEDLIRAEAEAVRKDGRSRAVLIYGTAGVGKTTLVQHLVREGQRDEAPIIWVPRIDVDDSEYWLLSNLETAIAGAVDPDRSHFTAYFEHLSKLPQYADQRADYESVLTHLGRTNRAFVDCYREFARTTGRTVVVILDTVEAIRAMYLLLTLVQWMKQLPSTLFVMVGRPLSMREHGKDPIVSELNDPHQPLLSKTIDLTGFTDDEAARYLDGSLIGGALEPEQRARLITLTAGQPLWLALATEYLRTFDPPPEMERLTADPQRDAEQFQRRLVTLYRGTDFWSEAIKRLAVVRHSVNEDVWCDLMADRPLPDGIADWHEAWVQLLQRPWIRSRANRRYVTLHDSLAEELAQRLIPLDDQDGDWRNGLWNKARNVYKNRTTGKSEAIRTELQTASTALRTAGPAERDALVHQIMQIDATKRELDQLMTARLHYELLTDPTAGTRRFLELCDRASDRRDPLFMELICHEVERFLPRGEVSEPLENVLESALRTFRVWLVHEAPDRYVAIAIRIAGFLIDNEQATSALDLLLLDDIPDISSTSVDLRYQLAIARGNASLRIAGETFDTERHLTDALQLAAELPDEEDRILRTAQAHKELGYYYRDLGRWKKADESYALARRVLADRMGPGGADRLRYEMASIQMNWAYLNALHGSYREARNLVDSALAVFRRFGQRQREGSALSVSGEAFRYEGKLARAWAEYRKAEELFHELKSWPWLGVIYQEQAICLHQAEREQITIVPNQAERARDLIKQAMDICRDTSSRNYPSALNRAGRIFAETDFDQGIKHLSMALAEAKRIGDGWIYSSSIIELVETCYRAWKASGDGRYRDLIAEREPEIDEATRTYDFTDLHGRWRILQAHLLADDSLADRDDTQLDKAVELFASGLLELATDRVASHGSVLVGQEFQKFHKVFEKLPQDVQRRWYQHLEASWSSRRSTLLLARLEELY